VYQILHSEQLNRLQITADAETQPDIEDKTLGLRPLVQRITEEATTAALLIFFAFIGTFVVFTNLQSSKRVKRSASTTATTTTAAAAAGQQNLQCSIERLSYPFFWYSAEG
jgi:hypothetical protein